MNKYIIIAMLSFVLVIPLVSAASMTAQNTVNINENFNLQISGSGFYAVEIRIPDHFQIVSDPSDGIRKLGLYKTFASGTLILILRPTLAGNHTITGQYTSGEGIKTMNPVTIEVKGEYIQSSCPICPQSTEWSNCEDSRRIRVVYICSALTGYHCIQSIETASCTMEQKRCEPGWTCMDSNRIAYQSSDCTLSSIQECFQGCENSKCIVSEVIKEQSKKSLSVLVTEGEERFLGIEWIYIIVGVVSIIILVSVYVKRKK